MKHCVAVPTKFC